MSDTFEYPTLRAAVLRGLVQLKQKLVEDDTVLGPDCPYDQETREVLRGLLAVQTVEKIVRVDSGAGGSGRGRGRPTKNAVSEESVDVVIGKVDDVMKQLEDLKSELGGKDMDAKTKLDIIKAQSNLLEKHVNMYERIHNVKRASNFEAVVINILDDLVDEDGRDQFLKRLAPFAGEGLGDVA